MTAAVEAAAVVLDEAHRIAELRLRLKDAQNRLRGEAHGTGRQVEYGMLIEALDAAEHALFNALNVASAYLDCPASKAAIDDGRYQ